MTMFLLSTECIIKHQNTFLIIKRPAGKLGEGLLAFPGGTVEVKDGEQQSDILRTAVKREVLEEVGINLVDPIYYITSSYFIDGKDRPVVHTIFYCKLFLTSPKVIPLLDEVPEHYWMTEKEVSQAPNAPEWIKKYLMLVEKKSCHCELPSFA